MVCLFFYSKYPVQKDLFLQSFLNSNRNRYGSADHRVITHSDKSHHLNISSPLRGLDWVVQ